MNKLIRSSGPVLCEIFGGEQQALENVSGLCVEHSIELQAGNGER
ncbi:MAG: hypothetical protein QF541_20050 [Lentisphaeria bacterium]|nr:hypothetical protein [Lentisphaeria bacterium]